MEGCEWGTPRYLIVGRAHAGHEKRSRAWKTWLYVVLIDCCLAESPTLQADWRMRPCCTNSSDIEIRSGPLFRIATQYTVPGLKGTWSGNVHWCGRWNWHNWILCRRLWVTSQSGSFNSWDAKLVLGQLGIQRAWLLPSPMTVPSKHWQLRRVTLVQTVRSGVGVLLCTIHQRPRAFGDCRQRHGGRLSVESFVTSAMQRLCPADLWWLCEVDVVKLYVQIVQATLLSLPLLWIPTPATKWSWRTMLSCPGTSGLRLLRLWSWNVMWTIQ